MSNPQNPLTPESSFTPGWKKTTYSVGGSKDSGKFEIESLTVT